jgi:hypothetical protein
MQTAGTLSATQMRHLAVLARKEFLHAATTTAALITALTAAKVPHWCGLTQQSHAERAAASTLTANAATANNTI